MADNNEQAKRKDAPMAVKTVGARLDAKGQQGLALLCRRWDKTPSEVLRKCLLDAVDEQREADARVRAFVDGLLAEHGEDAKLSVAVDGTEVVEATVNDAPAPWVVTDLVGEADHSSEAAGIAFPLLADAGDGMQVPIADVQWQPHEVIHRFNLTDLYPEPEATAS